MSAEKKLNRFAEFCDGDLEKEYQAAELEAFKRPISRIYPLFGLIFFLLSLSDFFTFPGHETFWITFSLRGAVFLYSVFAGAVMLKSGGVRLRLIVFSMAFPIVSLFYMLIIIVTGSDAFMSHSFSLVIILLGGILLGGRWIYQLFSGLFTVTAFLVLSKLIVNRDLPAYGVVEASVMLAVTLLLCLASSYLINTSRRNQFYRELQLERMSRTDPLTSLGNRQSFNETLAYLCEQPDKEFSVVIFDLDDFKRINDTYGHQAGDDALRESSALIVRHIRTGDIFARWGGEEFSIIFLGLPGWRALELAGRLCAELAEHEFSFGGRVTGSFGVTGRLPEDGARDIVGRADKALYEAKRGGKNRACLM